LQRTARRPRRAYISLLCLLAFAASSAHAEIINKILATVDGDPVTLFELHQFQQKDIRARQSSGNPDDALKALITDKVVQREVTDVGVIVRDEDVDRYIEGIKERNKIDDEKLKEALKQQGLTIESYRKQVREDLQRQQLISREIRGKVNVTPEEVERYYKDHISDYSTPERMQVAHILFALPADASSDQVIAITAKAEELRARIAKGADFAEMAKEYSEDRSGQEGGELGWFKKGEMIEAMEQAALKLKVGEVSQPVRTRLGLHLIKLEAKEGAGAKELSEVSDQIKQQLYSEALETRFEKWLTEDLYKRHHVEIF
ncbi:MAG TPA: peptidylprolyl isomerase, partial [Candidatus Acidoferrales bacterium]|nr:peptidylprolyl isomerase [Candidatus Acidoferrales bacterium]